MSKTLHEILQAIRDDLGDTNAEYLDANDPLVRATEKAAADLDRLAPAQAVEEYALQDFDVSDETFTSDYDTEVSLDNAPIAKGSENVNTAADGAGTAYTRDTDYTMDHWNGTITVLSTGDMADATSYYISYTKDRTVLDITGIEDDIINITAVEYPVGSVPQDLVQFQVHSGYVFILGRGKKPQFGMADDSYARVYYTTSHTLPTGSAGATWRVHLDDLIIRGAAGYTLLEKAQEYLFTSKAAVDSSETALDTIDTLAETIEARLDSVDSYLDAVDVALGSTFDTFLSDANADFVSAKTYAGKVETALVDVATQVALADTAADSVAGQMSSVTSQAALTVTDLTTALDYATGTVDPSAANYLTTWDGNINTVNKGQNVAENYAAFAEIALRIAQWFSDSRAMVRVQLCDRYLAIAQTRLAETRERMGLCNARALEAQNLVGAGNLHGRAGEGRLAAAGMKLQEAQTALGQANAVLGEVEADLGLIAQRIIQAQGYLGNATMLIELANRVKGEALQRLDEFRAMLTPATAWFTTIRTSRRQPS